MAVNWKDSGISSSSTNSLNLQPTAINAGIANETSTQKMQGTGDQNQVPLESFEECKHRDYDYNSENHPTVHHKCVYEDQNGRCTRDTCVYDAYETSKLCNKHWDTCILCGRTVTVPPNMMDVPICDLCRARLRFAETQKGFDCLLCGQHQSSPSKAPFSQICDNCYKYFIYCPNCFYWTPVAESPAKSYDYDEL